MQKIIYILFIVFSLTSCAQEKKNSMNINENTKNQFSETMKYNELTNAEKRVILFKETERPFSGELLNNKKNGTYVCKQCDAPLFRSSDKFDSQCGWPSFDDEIDGAIKRVNDADGIRTEIICLNCGAHLGHLFLNEGFTSKQIRYCVNSISLKFIPNIKNTLKKAYFASGCFWGTEYFFMKAPGVTRTQVGFMGGNVENPTYEQVCQKNTGHFECTEVEYDPKITSYEEMLKLFFETHDFTQTDGQGPDIGPQYRSCIFYSSQEEKQVAEKYINILIKMGYDVATILKPTSVFWEAEDYHQEYYKHKGGRPYCHNYKKIFIM